MFRSRFCITYDLLIFKLIQFFLFLFFVLSSLRRRASSLDFLPEAIGNKATTSPQPSAQTQLQNGSSNNNKAASPFARTTSMSQRSPFRKKVSYQDPPENSISGKLTTCCDTVEIVKLDSSRGFKFYSDYSSFSNYQWLWWDLKTRVIYMVIRSIGVRITWIQLKKQTKTKQNGHHTRYHSHNSLSLFLLGFCCI